MSCLAHARTTSHAHTVMVYWFHHCFDTHDCAVWWPHQTGATVGLHWRPAASGLQNKLVAGNDRRSGAEHERRDGTSVGRKYTAAKALDTLGEPIRRNRIYE